MIAKDILRKLAAKKPKTLESIKLLRNQMILNRLGKAHCKGKKKPLATSSQGACKVVTSRIYIRRK
jgi:hypothetical protein